MILGSVATPAFASALSISDLQQELQYLLAKIAALQQSQAAAPATSATLPTTPTDPNIFCPTIVRTLSLGSNGTDVASLQRFLAQNPLIYPEGAVTAYFGAFTQSAVQRWQSVYNIVSSGSPSTTGYGAVGPRTRAAIAASCVNNSASSDTSVPSDSSSSARAAAQQALCAVAPQPPTPCAGTWSTITSATGCTIAWQCAVPVPTIPASIQGTATCPANSQLINGQCVTAATCPSGYTLQGAQCIALVAPTPGKDVNASLAYGGVSRTYILHIPANYDPSKSYPLLMVFHGTAGSGAGMERNTQFNTTADQNGFFVAYPDSIGAQWVLAGSNNDLTFNMNVINAIESTYSINKARVVVSGYSQGGGMARQLACDYTSTFAGVATISENFNANSESGCHPSKPIPAVLFHGTADPISPYDGGTNGLGGATTYSAQVTAQFWATNNGCSGSPSTTAIPDTLDNGTPVTGTKQTWTGCASGAGVTFYTIMGGGHTWPGSTTDSGKVFNGISLGPVSQDINADQIIWQTLMQ